MVYFLCLCFGVSFAMGAATSEKEDNEIHELFAMVDEYYVNQSKDAEDFDELKEFDEIVDYCEGGREHWKTVKLNGDEEDAILYRKWERRYQAASWFYDCLYFVDQMDKALDRIENIAGSIEDKLDLFPISKDEFRSWRSLFETKCDFLDNFVKIQLPALRTGFWKMIKTEHRKAHHEQSFLSISPKALTESFWSKTNRLVRGDSIRDKSESWEDVFTENIKNFIELYKNGSFISDVIKLPYPDSKNTFHRSLYEVSEISALEVYKTKDRETIVRVVHTFLSIRDDRVLDPERFPKFI